MTFNCLIFGALKRVFCSTSKPPLAKTCVEVIKIKPDNHVFTTLTADTRTQCSYFYKLPQVGLEPMILYTSTMEKAGTSIK